MADYNEPQLLCEGTKVNCTITDYTPPKPSIKRIANKTLNGHSKFQQVGGTDCLIDFTVVFNIEDGNITDYKNFMASFYKEFTFIDEWGYNYTGYMQGDWQVKNPIEGDIYYIPVEMICPCNAGTAGW
ncbi:MULTISPECIES: hypothetical protein [Clostridium]|uniref:hypothetical protein n=1 Tax=Clostridium TaxID=1485 RepID=UPI000825EA56|nr:MULTISPECIES: hypothetical protein [Clostridium]PJI07039.1 hypothetical protein CUB90_03800 [Clostridium sp. CT7]